MAQKGRETPAGPPILGLAEAADLLEVSRAVVTDRRRRTSRPGDRFPPFPELLAEFECGPAWAREAIEAYRAENKRVGSLWRCERLAEAGLL